jgi:hypothetical protein
MTWKISGHILINVATNAIDRPLHTQHLIHRSLSLTIKKILLYQNAAMIIINGNMDLMVAISAIADAWDV